VSFKSVSSAILCAIKIHSNIKYITPKFEKAFRNIKIGLTAGVPVSKDNQQIFEETITLATRMCEVVNNPVVITNELKNLYESENKNAYIDKDLIRDLKPNEQVFLTKLMNFIEKGWQDESLNIDKFSNALGFSKSQLNRKMKSLTGKSPNNFIIDYRLNNALKLLHNQKGNISEIAFETGFNSLTYFSKCFKKKFKILPSKYLQQHIY
jgi:AraC-like DNA-binding protein